MSAFAIFLACLGAIALVGFVVSRVTGARSQYLAAFALEPGEQVLWQDELADAYPIVTRQAAFTSYRRARRYAVRVTNLRIFSACKPLFGSGHVIEHVLYPSDRPFPAEANGLSGGLFTRGYRTLVFERARIERTDGAESFVSLGLDPSITSSANLAAFRIYSEQLASFRLPD
jgi:hypothetical protein